MATRKPLVQINGELAELPAADRANDGRVDGWYDISDAWTFASATTINVPSGATSLYQKGDKIKFTQTTVKYFYIVAVANTLLTVTAGSDYSVANAAISAIAISRHHLPLGFPLWFNWTPGYTGFSANPTTLVAMFKIDGTYCFVTYLQNGLGTSNATTFTITGLPVSISSATSLFPSLIFGADGGANVTKPMRFDLSGTTFSPTPDPTLNASGGTGWTASGLKGVYGFELHYKY